MTQSGGIKSSDTISSSAVGEEAKSPQSDVSQKDRGYAWVIMVACFMSRVINSNGRAMSGVLLLELENSFHATEVELNAASTTQSCITLGASVFTSLCVSKFGARTTVMVGSCISTGAYLASSFASSITIFLVTHGIIAGFGNSCAFIGCFVPIYDYFHKYKAFALGFITTGYSIGFFIWPPVVTVMFNHFGWRGTFMLLAGLQFNGCVVGALLRPFPENKKKEDTVKDNSKGRVDLKSQMRVFRNKYFYVLNVINILYYMGIGYTPAYSPKLADDLGASETNSALLGSIYGIFDGVSVILHGIVGDCPWFRCNRLTLQIYAFLMAGINKICSIEANMYAYLAVFSAFDGFASGSASGLTYTVVSDLVTEEQRAFASGILSLFLGIFLLVGNLSTGWMYSYFGTLSAPAIALGSCQVLAALLATCMYAHMKLKSRNTCDVTTPQSAEPC